MAGDLEELPAETEVVSGFGCGQKRVMSAGHFDSLSQNPCRTLGGAIVQTANRARHQMCRTRCATCVVIHLAQIYRPYSPLSRVH